MGLREIINREHRKKLREPRKYSEDEFVNRILQKLDGYKPKEDNYLYGKSKESRLTRKRSLTEMLGGIIRNDR
jgi:hypothetical protein